MHPESFQPNAPGNLRPTTLYRRRYRGDGVPEVEPVAGWAFCPAPLPPALDWPEISRSLHEEMLDAVAGVARLDGSLSLVHNARAMLKVMWIREARESSAIEDIHTSALDMVSVRSQDTPKAGPHLEAYNAVTALEAGLRSELPYSGGLMRDMHRVLMSGVRGDDKRPGEFRDGQAYIGDERHPERARFVPPPPGRMPGEVEACIGDLERFVNTPPPEIHALLAIAMSHYQFEAIHPFRDGNGRLGRALIVHQMCRSGLIREPVFFVSGYLYDHKVEYVNAMLAVSTHGDWTRWFRFFLRAVATQSAVTCTVAERLVHLRHRFAEIVKEHGLNGRVLRLIDALFEWPMVSAREAATILGVVDATARKDLQRLVSAGVLFSNADQAHDRRWHAPDLIRIIDEGSAG
jgi:Fic family protein